jgi:hypothetical protein
MQALLKMFCVQVNVEKLGMSLNGPCGKLIDRAYGLFELHCATEKLNAFLLQLLPAWLQYAEQVSNVL